MIWLIFQKLVNRNVSELKKIKIILDKNKDNRYYKCDSSNL